MAKFKFKSDAAELTKWLGSRKKSLQTTREPMEKIWKELRKYHEPSLGKSLLEGDQNQLNANRDDENILNSEPRILVHRMAAGLQSGITNQSRAWFHLKAKDEAVAKSSAVRKWQDETTDLVSGMMNRSNTYQSLDQIYMHLGQFGTACALVLPDDTTDIHIKVCDCGAYWIAEDKRGRVNTLLRSIEMTTDQMIDKFGEGWIPTKLMEAHNKGQHEKAVRVCHYVGPHKPDLVKDILPGRPFISIYWIEGYAEDENRGMLAIRSFSYNPILCPRWSVFNSVYGIGCGHIGLADAKQLQQQESDKLRVVELDVDPAMAAPTSMKDMALNTGASGITYYPDTQGGRVPVTRLFETRQNLDSILRAIADTENRLKRIWFADLFAMMINLNMQPKQMTAREVNELSGEKVALLGPILTRLNNDLLNPLIDSIFAIASDGNLLSEAPDVLQGQELKIEYVSSLHVEQSASSRLSGLYRIFEFASGVAKFYPDIVDKLDCDESVDIAAKALTEYGIVRDNAEVKKIRAARAKQQQEMAAAEAQARAVPAMARAAKDLGQTPLGNGNALEAAMAAQAGGQQ